MSAATVLTLANGRGIDLLAPTAAQIDFSVIAEQLAKENRFNGATPGVGYSVAEHCCRGADAILQHTGDARLAAYFLLHDAHEHALKDDTTPKKRALAELAQEHFGVLAAHIVACFDLLTYRHDLAIHAAAGLAWPPPIEMSREIKRWDLVMLVTEWRDLMRDAPHPDPEPYRDIVPLPDRIWPWTWPTACTAYLRRCNALLPCCAERGGA